MSEKEKAVMEKLEQTYKNMTEYDKGFIDGFVTKAAENKAAVPDPEKPEEDN